MFTEIGFPTILYPFHDFDFMHRKPGILKGVSVVVVIVGFA